MLKSLTATMLFWDYKLIGSVKTCVTVIRYGCQNKIAALVPSTFCIISQYCWLSSEKI